MSGPRGRYKGAYVVGRGQTYEHVLVAERAVGHVLPPGVQVHHIDRDPWNNERGNLVICQDAAYHSLLHSRLDALEGCGNPDWRRCVHCGQWDALGNFRPRNGTMGFAHPTCDRRAQQEWRDKRRAARPPCEKATHCNRGHPYDDANTMFVRGEKPGQVWRKCRLCTNAAWLARYRRLQEESS